MFNEYDNWEEHHLVVYFVFSKCAECLKYPCSACHIRPLEQGGEKRFYNYIPLCVRHSNELFRIGTIAMMSRYANVCSYILAKGWEQTNTLTHPDMRSLT